VFSGMKRMLGGARDRGGAPSMKVHKQERQT